MNSKLLTNNNMDINISAVVFYVYKPSQYSALIHISNVTELGMKCEKAS